MAALTKIEISPEPKSSSILPHHVNLIVLRSCGKAKSDGLKTEAAGICLGSLSFEPDEVAVGGKEIKPSLFPYNILIDQSNKYTACQSEIASSYIILSLSMMGRLLKLNSLPSGQKSNI